ncbi:hypothetical protein ABPG72_018147 [Tetrahymena utriculariae]
MLALAKQNGCKNKCSLFFLYLNIAIAFILGVITAYMSSNGCSRAFTSVAIISFLYIILNLMLIYWSKSWNKCFSFVSLFFVFTTFLITVVGIGFAAYQSTCDVIACYKGLQSEIDSFYHEFHSKINSNLDDQQCTYLSNQQIGDAISSAISYYAKQTPDKDKYFYIQRGWPIVFLSIQMVLTLIHATLTFFNLYSCKGCKAKPKEESYISYF